MKVVRQLIALALFILVGLFGVQYGKLFLIKHEIEKVAAKNRVIMEDVEIVPAITPTLVFSVPDNNRYISGKKFRISQKLDEFKTANLQVDSLKLYRKKSRTLLLQSTSFSSSVEYKDGGLHFSNIAAKENATNTKVGKFAFPDLTGRFSYTLKSKELSLKLKIPSLRTAKSPDVDITAVSISGTVICAKNGANGRVKLLVSKFKPSLFKHLEKTKTIKKGFGKFLQFGSQFLSGMFKGGKVPIIIDFKDGIPNYTLELPSYNR